MIHTDNLTLLLLPYRSGQMAWGLPEGVGILDVIPEHFKPLVHSHWLNFPPVNPMWHYLLAIIFIILGIISFLGNGTVMYLFMTKKSLRSPANMFIVNLAFSDFLMMLTQYPAYVYSCLNGGYFSFGPLGCQIYAFLGSLSGDTSLLTLVAIGYDRYCVIVKAFDGGHISSMKAFAIIVLCWIYSGGVAIWPFFGWGEYIPEGILTSCSFDYLSTTWNAKSFGLFLFIACYCIPMIFIMYFYSHIVMAIQRHEKALRDQAKKMNVENLRSNASSKESQEVRIAKVALANVGLWFVTWTPYAYVVLTGLFGAKMSITPLISALPALIAKTASCYNPMMFAISHPKFRLALQESMPWFCIHEPEDDDTKSSKTLGMEVKADK